MHVCRKMALGWIGLTLLAACATAGTLSFVPGHYYSTAEYSSDITQRDQDGSRVGSISLHPATIVAALTFGPDNLLYAYNRREADVPGQTPHQIVAISPQGIVQRYSIPEARSDWDIVFDNDGHFYFGKFKFNLGESDSAQLLFNQGKVPFQSLPDGGFMAKDSKAIYQLDYAGKVVREIFRVPVSTDYLTSAAYDPIAENLFISGGTFNRQGIFKIDVHTGQRLATAHYHAWYDISIAANGYLLIRGGGGWDPMLFDQDLNLLQELDWNAEFITQYVPEPSALLLAGVALTGFLGAKVHQMCRIRKRK